MKHPLSALFLLTLAACHSSQQPVTPLPGWRADEKSIAGVYEGTLPCVDCDGIRTRLNLMPGYRYDVQETYLGKSTLVFNDHGRWVFNRSNAHVDLLSNHRSYVLHFHGVSPEELRMLDRESSEITGAQMNLSLKRVHQG